MIATTAHVPAAPVPTAIRCAASSYRPNQRQLSVQSIAGASHGGRPGQALVAGNDRQRDTPHLRGGFTFLTLQSTCRGLRGSGLSHSHRPGFSSLTGRLVAERAFPAALAITNSRALGCRPFRLKRLPHQHLVNAMADRLHHRVPSSSAISVGIDPNENGLTHEAQPLSPDDKIHD